MPTSAALHRRAYGVLLHPSSLPGREPIGTLGAEAFEFVDWLAEAAASIWQTLPLTINGKFDSPYFSLSAFAGNIWLIDVADLAAAGLVELDELDGYLHAHPLDARVDFARLYRVKWPILVAAADRFLASSNHPWRADHDEFATRSGAWLDDTCRFFALRDAHGTPEWWTWPDDQRMRLPEALAAVDRQLASSKARWRSLFYFFDRQWGALMAHAHERGLTILGDLPIYVAPESADVWANQDQFRLDDAGRMTVQSGVPPDYFSATGQLWRNPLYRWDEMAEDGYRWWLGRLGRCLELCDIVRIDHFRALSAYWEVAADADDAMGGHWVDGPGQHFLDAVRAAFPEFPLVAEDLGTLDDAVHALRDDNGLPGMRILQFGFDGTPDNPHLPAAISERAIVYTGTHDNEPIGGWWDALDPGVRSAVAATYQHPVDADTGRAVWSFIEAAFGSRAVAAVFPVQDLLVLDERARMNEPSSEVGNWGWRMPRSPLSQALAKRLSGLATQYRRSGSNHVGASPVS